MLGSKRRVDFANNARVESYDDKYLFMAILGHLCGGGEHQINRTPRQRKRTRKLLLSKNLLALS